MNCKSYMEYMFWNPFQSYFTALLETLNILIEFFYGGKQQGNPQQPQDETLLKMKRQLQLYASDSPVLISRLELT